MDIDDWREEINKLDERLVELLNRRAQCALEIGRIKQALGLPVYLPDREAEVIEHVLAVNKGPLQSDAVRRLFERIIDESRRIERITVEQESSELKFSAKTEGRE